MSRHRSTVPNALWATFICDIWIQNTQFVVHRKNVLHIFFTIFYLFYLKKKIFFVGMEEEIVCLASRDWKIGLLFNVVRLWSFSFFEKRSKSLWPVFECRLERIRFERLNFDWIQLCGLIIIDLISCGSLSCDCVGLKLFAV